MWSRLPRRLLWFVPAIHNKDGEELGEALDSLETIMTLQQML